MRALVTGGAGFIGSHIVAKLLAEGHRVAVVDDLSTGKRENVPAGAQFYRMSLLDPELPDVVQQIEPDVVFHQAAQVKVSYSLADPVQDARINIEGSLRLLEACRKAGLPKVVYASSAAVYGEPQTVPLPEDHPLAPLSPYGLSKLTVERYLAIYHSLYGLRYAVLRYANVYGPRQDSSGEGGVVAIFADRAVRGKPLVIYGDGSQTRDFVYVEDVATANLLAANPDLPGELVVNIGTGREISVNELARAVAAQAGHELPFVYEAPRAGEIRRSSLANGRAISVLGWYPATDLAEGLGKTLAWYRAHALPGIPEK
ncbi:MAG: NAD-dependent epimerase/dehydratase family protein [Limnochordales bacterium]|nr:NAD-dependent epimerase/dehydratase family protein [Limnochordales bacterium]